VADQLEAEIEDSDSPERERRKRPPGDWWWGMKEVGVGGQA